MKVYEEQLNKVKSATEKLRTRLLEAESRLPAFRKLTGDVIERIKAIGAEHFLHFLKLWFRTFLGMRDECMILITGEIVRNYHIEPHRDYIHERNRESHYYNKDCSLSLCSSDGIDFEYRQLQSKYGSKSAFDKIADAADEIGGRLHALYQSINACHDRLADFIKSLKICKYDADFERFCAESIDIIYIAGEEKKKVTLSSHTYRTCKRAQALSTVVEDPPNVNIAPAATSRVSNDQVTKKPRIRIDLEDSDEEMDVAPSQPVKTDPTLALDFQFTASIEEIKNAYNPPPEQTEPLFGSGNGTAGNAAQQTQQPIFLPYSHISTFCLDSPEMVLARVKVVDPLFVTTANQQDTVGKDHVNLTLPVHHVYNMLDSKTRSKVAQQMLATDLLDEITKLLWLSPLQCVDNHAADSVKLDQCSVDNMCRIWLPKFIQVERVKYSRGAVIPLPEFFSTKRFAVFCESDPLSLGLCQTIQHWVHHDLHGNLIRDRQQVLQRQKIVFDHKDYVLLLARYLRKLIQDPHHVLHLSNQFSPCPCRTQYDDIERKLCHSFKIVVLQHVSPPTTAVVTKISSFHLGPDDFIMLCRYSESVAIDASSLNIPAVQIYLRSLATFMTSVQENVLNYQWRLQKLSLCDESTSVNLSSSGDLPDGSDVDMMFDVMLEALEDRQWRDVWSEAIECICIHSPQLTTLTLMHLTSNKLQLLVLVVGIVRAMQRRQEIIQQDIVYCIESNIGEKERGADILNIVKKRLSALSSPNATQMLTISIREHIVCIPSLLDISM